MKKHKKSSWDGDKYEPRCIGVRRELSPETKDRDIPALERKLKEYSRRFTQASTMGSNTLHGKDRHSARLRMSDDLELQFAEQEFDGLIAQITARLKKNKSRWISAEYRSATRGTITFENPNLLTKRTMTDGAKEWIETSWTPSEDAPLPTFVIREPTAEQKLKQTRETFDALPALENCHEDNEHEPRWHGWVELKDGRKLQFAENEQGELDAKLKTALKKYGARVKACGDKVIPRHVRAKVHPLKWSRDRIEHAIALSEKLFEDHREEQSIISAWELGFELGLACLNYERNAAIPNNLRIVDMAQGKAGAAPKRSKQMHLKHTLQDWLTKRGHRNGDTSKGLVGEFWDFAKTLPRSFKCSGNERTGTIAHRQDLAGYKCQHLIYNVVPRLRKSLSASRSA